MFSIKFYYLRARARIFVKNTSRAPSARDPLLLFRYNYTPQTSKLNPMEQEWNVFFVAQLVILF